TDTSSANYVMPGCRDFISSNSVTPAYPFVQGFCAGVIQGLIYDSHDICLPSGVEKGQAVRIVVQYIDSQPARLHENFMRWRLKPCVRHGHANGETELPDSSFTSEGKSTIPSSFFGSQTLYPQHVVA